MKKTPRLEWKKVRAPRTWYPKRAGEELIGFYGGTTERRGRYGSYSVVLVHDPNRGSFMVSGVQVLQLVDASSIEAGDPIRIVFNGTKDLGEGDDGRAKHMKLFDVYESTGAPLTPDELEALRKEQPE